MSSTSARHYRLRVVVVVVVIVIIIIESQTLKYAE